MPFHFFPPNLEKITISASAVITSNPFQGFTSVSFSLSGTGPMSVSEDGKILMRNGNEIISYPSASGSITLNGITVISNYAFAGTAITEINLPNVTRVGNDSFNNCSGLKEVVMPNAMSIGNYCFYYTGETALTIVLGLAAPEVGYSTFLISGSSTTPKPITVKVPSAATGYDETWQDAFKGKGTAGTGTVNQNIALSIVEYGE
jgi:hypothetical protein